MSHEVTATKFRPQSFNELIGQEFVAETLKNSINNKRIANAYLLSGPRGVGKTSAARIIAKSLNCINGPTGIPCNKCDNCISITNGNNNDVIEIDGASNTGINDIRIIQEEIQYPPVNSKYKVYIIDEVHMLSKSAFNALLKTIEEPPDNVVFIFATTEINKVIPTIRSRCQQFNFRLIPQNLIFEALKKVLDQYKINYEDSAIKWIANEGQGSMRDAYTLLDQVFSFCGNEITLKKIHDKLGLISEEKISLLVQGIIENSRELVFTEYFSMIEYGISPEQIISDLIIFFRNILFVKANLPQKNFIDVNSVIYEQKFLQAFSFEDIENILNILFITFENSKFAIDLQLEIEICLLKILKYKDFIRPGKILSELKMLKDSLLNDNNTSINNKYNDNITKNKSSSFKQESSNQQNKEIKFTANKSEILKIIKSKLSSSHFQLTTALNNISYIEEKDNQMFIYFTHKIHYDIAKGYEDMLTQEAISIIGEKYNKNFKIKIEFKAEEKKQSVGEINKQNIKTIFHGQEL